MDTIESNRHISPIVLLGVAGGYAFFNFMGVLLAAKGVVHPPWGILDFFTWLGPMGLALGLLSFQFIAKRRGKLVQPRKEAV